MPDPVTTNMQFAVPTRGSDVGTWDVPTNGDWNIADAAFGGVASIAVASSPITLSISQAQNSVLRFSGVLTGNVAITLPAIVKFWTVYNLAAGNFVITMTTGAGNVIGIPAGSPMSVYSDGSNMYYNNLGLIGTYVDYAGAAVPSWVTACTVPPFLNCDGSTYDSAGVYGALGTILGTNVLPDLRGRARYALNGGTGRITTAVSGINGDARFSSGGFQSITLDTTMIPAHTHTATVTDPGHIHNTNAAANSSGSAVISLLGSSTAVTTNTSSSTTGITVSNANTGGGLAHNNMPPAAIGGITMIRAG